MNQFVKKHISQVDTLAKSPDRNPNGTSKASDDKELEKKIKKQLTQLKSNTDKVDI